MRDVFWTTTKSETELPAILVSSFQRLNTITKGPAVLAVLNISIANCVILLICMVDVPLIFKSVS